MEKITLLCPECRWVAEYEFEQEDRYVSVCCDECDYCIEIEVDYTPVYSSQHEYDAFDLNYNNYPMNNIEPPSIDGYDYIENHVPLQIEQSDLIYDKEHNYWAILLKDDLDIYKENNDIFLYKRKRKKA